jgi:hypothetical protein
MIPWWVAVLMWAISAASVVVAVVCLRKLERSVDPGPPWVDTTADDPMLPDPDDEPPPDWAYEDEPPVPTRSGVTEGTKFVVNGSTLHTVKCQYVQPWLAEEAWPSTRAAIPPLVERKTLTSWMDAMDIHACSKCNPLDEEVTP